MTRSRSWSRSHCDAKRVARASARGNVSSRLACFESAPGRPSPPCDASFSSSASGPLPNRKNDSRDASS